jgi:pectate lyase
MMKKMKIVLSILLLTIVTATNAQTYNFSAPQGYGNKTTGGGSGKYIVVTNQNDLKKYLTGTAYDIIIVKGTIQCNYMSIEVKNKTLLGLPGARLVNNDQTEKGSGILNLNERSSNVIIRNLIFEGPGAYDVEGRDLLCFRGDGLWVDHCEFQDAVDENFSFKRADNITVSWSKFTYLKPFKSGGPGGTDDHRFSNLVNGSDSEYPSDGKSNITWQYCWWAEGCVERMVRARNATLHMVNCYWNSPNTKVAIGLGDGKKGCSNYVENGVFDLPSKANVTKLNYGGSPAIKFVNCTGGGSNQGTVSKPSYSYEVIPAGSVVKAVTNSNCGAGATLKVTEKGEISSSCDGGDDNGGDGGDTTPDNEITIQEGQKGFCGVDGTIDSNHGGYTGSGFANTDNFTGKGVNYKINVGTSGNYTITVRYANGATDRPADILHNGVKVGTISLPGTGSWASWSSATKTVSLGSGTKSLRLQTTGSSGLPNIDYIKISGASISAVDCGDTTTPTTPPPASSDNEIHNFTQSGKTSSFYNISGNLSDSKGTVTYNGLTLTQCLKIESSTSISFNAAQSGTLTLVFNSNFNGAIKVNGSSKNVSSGILSVNLSAGNHTLTKDDSANLYYISFGSELKSSTVSGLSEQPSELKLSLYPNPVQSVLSIEMDSELAEGALIEFFNISGNLIKNQKVTRQNQTMDVSDLKPGLYLVKVSSPYGSVISRLIKL